MSGRMSCAQAAAKAQAEAERRQKEEMNRRRSRLQASMAEVTSSIVLPAVVRGSRSPYCALLLAVLASAVDCNALRPPEAYLIFQA